MIFHEFYNCGFRCFWMKVWKVFNLQFITLSGFYVDVTEELLLGSPPPEPNFFWDKIDKIYAWRPPLGELARWTLLLFFGQNVCLQCFAQFRWICLLQSKVILLPCTICNYVIWKTKPFAAMLESLLIIYVFCDTFEWSHIIVVCQKRMSSVEDSCAIFLLSLHAPKAKTEIRHSLPKVSVALYGIVARKLFNTFCFEITKCF